MRYIIIAIFNTSLLLLFFNLIRNITIYILIFGNESFNIMERFYFLDLLLKLLNVPLIMISLIISYFFYNKLNNFYFNILKSKYYYIIYIPIIILLALFYIEQISGNEIWKILFYNKNVSILQIIGGIIISLFTIIIFDKVIRYFYKNPTQ